MKATRRQLAALVLLAALVPAAGVSADQSLTAAELDRFIADWPAIVAYANQRGRALEANPLALGVIRGYDELLRYIRDRGWEPERLFEVMARATTGIAALEMEELMPGMLQEFEDQKHEIRQDAYLSSAQKQEAIDGLDAMLAQITGWASFGTEITGPEKALIRARRDRLEAALQAQ